MDDIVGHVCFRERGGWLNREYVRNKMNCHTVGSDVDVGTITMKTRLYIHGIQMHTPNDLVHAKYSSKEAISRLPYFQNKINTNIFFLFKLLVHWRAEFFVLKLDPTTIAMIFIFKLLVQCRVEFFVLKLDPRTIAMTQYI